MSIKDDKNTDFRLQYLVQSFKSISRKPFETYVIQRIWHRLGDDRVRFVFQQYVNRGEKDRYALADLYLPQVKMVVEVNEKYHYTTEEQKERDRLRNAEVAKRGKVDVRVVNCDQPLEAVHKEIDKVVEEIRSRIKNLGDKFVPWDGYVLHDAEYYKKKGSLNVDDNIYVQTIDDACEIFGIKGRWVTAVVMGSGLSVLLGVIVGSIAGSFIGIATVVVGVALVFFGSVTLQVKLPSRQIGKKLIEKKVPGWIIRRETLSRVVLEDPLYKEVKEQLAQRRAE